MNVNVTKVFLGNKKNGYLGTAVVLFDDSIEVKFSLFEGRESGNIRVSAPSRKVGDKWYNDVYITSDKLREIVEQQVIHEYNQELARSTTDSSRAAGKKMAEESVASGAKINDNDDIPF